MTIRIVTGHEVADANQTPIFLKVTCVIQSFIQIMTT